MKTCDTCKWWLDERSPETDRLMRRCGCPKVASEENMQEPVRYGNYNEPRVVLQSDDMVWASAGDYYPADIVTGPKFGCVHHEPK